MTELTSERVSDLSEALLGLLEHALGDLGPAEAATVIAHLAGRLQGKHGEREHGLKKAVESWKTAWDQPSVQGVFEHGFRLERRNLS